MSAVWIVLAIAAVAVVIGAVVIFRKQAATADGAAPPRSVQEPAGKRLEEAPEKVKAEAPARTEEGVAEPTPADRRAEAAAEAVPEAPPPKPEPSPEELRDQVEQLLAESDRMLGELRELKGGGDDETENGTVEVLREGLQEVRSLASRDKWGQAKDKGEALKSQLVTMLRSTRREQGS